MAISGFTGWVGPVLGAPDPVALGTFYADLLGGELDVHDETFVTIKLAGTSYVACQLEPDHVPPVWPAGPGDQQMQLHLDVGVSVVADAVADAERLGARLAAFQPQEDVRVMLDPAGHPFCLYLDEG